MSFQVTVSFTAANEFSFDPSIVQVSGGFASLVDLGGGTYSTANPIISTNFPLTASNLIFMIDSTSQPAGSAIRYLLEIDRIDRYYDGSSWVNSDGSYAQSMTSFEINLQLSNLVSDLGLTGNFPVKLKTFLNSDGTATPSIFSFNLQMNYEEPAFTDIDECAITVNLGDLIGNNFTPSQAPVLYVTNDRSFNHGNNVIVPFTKSVTFDAQGQATIDVIETETVGEKLNFFITYFENKSRKTVYFEPAVVPNTTSRPLTEITTVVDQDLG